jgi:exonuclease SbcC
LDDLIDGGATTMLASGAREVSDAVERLVGLDYDAFTHAVILPQSEFARFLKGDPGTRRRIPAPR